MIQDQIIDCVNNYYKFFKWSWSSISQEKFIDNWHIKYLCDKLQELSYYIIERKYPPHDLYLFNLPPGESKSTICAQSWSMWLWLQDPSLCSMWTTFSYPLSERNAGNAKKIIKDSFFEYFNQYIEYKHGKRLKLKIDRDVYFTNNYGGEYSAATIDGPTMGFHFNVLGWDDIVDPRRSASEASRNHANIYLDQVQPNRKKYPDSTPEIGIMQRLHMDDPTGHELAKKGKKIFHVCLPGELSDDIKPIELKKYYINGLFDSKRLTRKVLNKKKIDLGSYGYSGQIMQRPSPEEGGLLKKEYWNIINENEVPQLVWNMFIDGAYTKKKKNDPSGILIAGKYNGKVYVKFAISKWMESPEILKYVPECFDANGLNKISKILIEPKASGQSLRPHLNNMGYNAIDIKSYLVGLDKVARVKEVLARIESGKVNLIKGHWNNDFIEQCAIFPNGAHDEYTDLTSYAVDELLSVEENNLVPQENINKMYE